MEPVFFYKVKGSVSYLEGYKTRDGQYFKVSQKKFPELRLFKQVDKYYITYAKQAPRHDSMDTTIKGCNKELKEWLLDNIVLPTPEIPFPNKEEVENSNQQLILEDKFNHLERLIKGLNKDLLRQYCKQFYDLGYKAGVEMQSGKTFEILFNEVIK